MLNRSQRAHGAAKIANAQAGNTEFTNVVNILDDGLRVFRSLHTELVMGALEQALWARGKPKHLHHLQEKWSVPDLIPT